AVVLVEGIGDQRVALHVQRVPQLAAAAQAHRRVAVAVTVGLVGEAARAPALGGAAAGIDAVGALPGALGLEPAALAGLADARARLAPAVAADAQAGVRAQSAAGAPVEDLDHAADGLRAVQAGSRAAHDLDALDLVQRQVLVHDHARRCRADAHAVNHHQHVVGFGAAHEHRGQLPRATLVGEVD